MILNETSQARICKEFGIQLALRHKLEIKRVDRALLLMCPTRYEEEGQQAELLFRDGQKPVTESVETPPCVKEGERIADAVLRHGVPVAVLVESWDRYPGLSWYVIYKWHAGADEALGSIVSADEAEIDAALARA